MTAPPGRTSWWPDAGWWRRVWQTWLRPAGHLFLPRICLSCDEAAGDGDGLLCRSCRGGMGRLRRASWCRDCGRAVPVRAPREPCDQCGPCRVPGVARVLRVSRYAAPINGLILAIKYGRRPDVADTVADWMHRRVGWEPVDAVIPVPLFADRERARGYNQARLLAEGVARRLGRPVAEDVVRVRDTAQQTQTDHAGRTANVAGAFALRPGAAPAGLRYLLVDDVMTTGATVSAVAGVLRQAGAARVTVLVAAVAALPWARWSEEHPEPGRGSRDSAPGAAGRASEIAPDSPSSGAATPATRRDDGTDPESEVSDPARPTRRGRDNRPAMTGPVAALVRERKAARRAARPARATPVAGPAGSPQPPEVPPATSRPARPGEPDLEPDSVPAPESAVGPESEPDLFPDHPAYPGYDRAEGELNWPAGPPPPPPGYEGPPEVRRGAAIRRELEALREARRQREREQESDPAANSPTWRVASRIAVRWAAERREAERRRTGGEGEARSAGDDGGARPEDGHPERPPP